MLKNPDAELVRQQWLEDYESSKRSGGSLAHSSYSSGEEKKDDELFIKDKKHLRRATLFPSNSHVVGTNSLEPSWMNKQEVVPQALKLQKTF
jgi:hypothetical protein